VERFAMLRAAIGYAHANTVITRLAGNITQQRHASEIFHLSTAIIGMVVVADSEAEFRQLCARALTGPGYTLDVEGQEIEIDVRVGVSMSADAAATADQLLEQAAIALDHARLRKRRFIEFNTETFPDPKVQLALTSDIVKGLERGDFSLVYQAKADARSGVCVGAEALIRWRHPELGVVAPDRFVPVAEETGAIDDLSRWVLRQALRDQAELRGIGIDAPLSINLSGRLLVDGGFCAAAIDAVTEAGANLCIEVTETAIISDPQAAMDSIAAFRAAGIKISIDDYGAGLSSLSYLKQIAADELKLDKSLIGDIRSTERDRLILRSTIDLAHSLGMQVVAEGVEDDATRAVLVGLGCDTLQGYLISRPIELGAFIGRFAERAPMLAAGGQRA
jgi:EAL domain-containing protein (putative c-di-GMP-specific phosphodiesterase class I)